MEKVSLELIRRILEITKEERNHELLLSVKNLRELSFSPFPYIVPFIPLPLPAELVRGEHFTLTGLLKSILGNSLQAGFTQEPQVETAQETSASFVRPDQSPLDEQDSRPASQVVKKKNNKGKIIADGVGLEGFVDFVDPNTSDSAKERENDMSSLIARFSAQMRKWAVSAQRETTLGSEVFGEKCPKSSSPNEEAQRSSALIAIDSLELAFDALPALEGVA